MDLDIKQFDEEQYYDIYADDELYCRMVLPKEFEQILDMAVERASDNIAIRPVIVFMNGFDTYVTTKLV